MAEKRPVALYDGVLKEIQVGDTLPQTLASSSLEIVLSTTGNGTNTFTLSKAVTSVIVAVDGVLQYDFVQPNGTDQLVLGFIPELTETVLVYATASGGASTPPEDSIFDGGTF